MGLYLVTRLYEFDELTPYYRREVCRQYRDELAKDVERISAFCDTWIDTYHPWAAGLTFGWGVNSNSLTVEGELRSKDFRHLHPDFSVLPDGIHFQVKGRSSPHLHFEMCSSAGVSGETPSRVVVRRLLVRVKLLMEQLTDAVIDYLENSEASEENVRTLAEAYDHLFTWEGVRYNRHDEDVKFLEES